MQAKTAASEQFQFVPIEWITPSKTNPRKHFGDLSELVASVTEHGVLVPLIVRRVNNTKAEDLQYEIVAGERRFRAAKQAQLGELPVRILELDDKQTLELQLIENLQRADVHPIEEADGYQRLIDKYGYNAAGLAARVGKSESYIYQRLKLATLIPKAKEAFYDEKLTASHAILIARLDEQQQKQALGYAVGPRPPPSARQFEEWVHKEFYLDLHAAPWKKDDGELVPAAGPCVRCPKRSGFLPALFPELAKGKDLCQDANCYRGKQAAFLARSLADNPELKPIAVGYIGANEKKALQKEYGSQLQTIQNWEITRGKKKPANAQQGLVVDGHGARVGELVWFAREKQGGQETAADKRWKTLARRNELNRDRKSFARQKLAGSILAAVPPVPAERELRIVAKAFYSDIWHELRKRIATGHGVKADKGSSSQLEKLMFARIDTWGQSELTPFLIELAIAKDLYVGLNDGGEALSADLSTTAAAYKLNPKNLIAAGEAEWKRLQKAKEERRKKKPAAAKAAKKKAAKPAARKARKKVAGGLKSVADIVHRLHTESEAKKGGTSATKAKAAAATA